MNNKNPIDSKPMIKELQEKLKNKNFKDVIKKCDTILNDASESKVELYLFKAYALRDRTNMIKLRKIWKA